MARLKVHFRLPCGAVREAVGREGTTLLRLIEAGQHGITPIDAHRAGPAFRLAAYCHGLRKLGVPILMEREPHLGGWNGRYRLAGDVEIVWRADEPESEAA
jgi:hypothetical protein